MRENIETSSIRLKGTKYDWIATLHIAVVVFSYLYAWNACLAEWIMPNQRDNDLFDIFFCGCLGIMLFFAWFVLVGALSGMFLTFEWCDKKLNETRW